MAEESGEGNKVYIKCSISGKPAKVLLELKSKGYCRSNVDALSQGLLALWKEVVRRELEEAQLKASKKLEGE